MAERRPIVRGVMAIGVFIGVAVVALVVIVVAGQGAGARPVEAKVVSVSMGQSGLAPSQIVCASGGGGKYCTTVAPGEPGSPFEVGDCVSIATEGDARSILKPRICD